MYAQCLKLAAENKITQKNTWDLSIVMDQARRRMPFDALAWPLRVPHHQHNFTDTRSSAGWLWVSWWTVPLDALRFVRKTRRAFALAPHLGSRLTSCASSACVTQLSTYVGATSILPGAAQHIFELDTELYCCVGAPHRLGRRP